MKSAIATAVAVMLLASCVTVKPPTYVSGGSGWYTVKRSANRAPVGRQLLDEFQIVPRDSSLAFGRGFGDIVRREAGL